MDDSTDRTAKDFVMFALAFIGFLLALAGVELNSISLSIFGALVLVFSVYSFAPRSSSYP